MFQMRLIFIHASLLFQMEVDKTGDKIMPDIFVAKGPPQSDKIFSLNPHPSDNESLVYPQPSDI